MKESCIGENIRFYRERANFTQQQLADRVGVTWEMISRYERNENSALKKLEKISNALNVSPGQLLQEHIPENVNRSSFRIPLLVKDFNGNWFKQEFNNFYYSAPEWIFQNNIEALAVDGDIVDSEYRERGESVIYFIVEAKSPKINDRILVRNGKEVVEEKYDRQKSNVIIGKVIAKEVRY